MRYKIKKTLFFCMVAGGMALLSACTAKKADRKQTTGQQTTDQESVTQTEGETTMTYISISMAQAVEAWEKEGDYIILDVRRADEYAGGHIPGAIHVANESIKTERPEELPDLDKTIYVYCRSGRRSKQAAEKLAAMGYSAIIECGGILDYGGPMEYGDGLENGEDPEYGDGPANSGEVVK